jgi:hypothetical protein
LNILESIYTKIKETAGVYNLIGGATSPRAYPIRADQDCAKPYIVFETIPGMVPHAMNTDSGSEQVHALFRCYDEHLPDAYALALAVIAAFQDFSGTLGTSGVTVARIFRTGDVVSEYDMEASSEGLFMALVDFEIWFTR